jgi:hypothetical protein
MSANIEIWKIFEDDHLATYAFGDMGLFSSKAKGKVVVLKKTGEIFLVEKTDKTLSHQRFEDVFAPKIRHALTEFQKHGVFPNQKNLPELDLPVPPKEDVSGAKDVLQWRDALMTNAIKGKLDKILISFFTAAPDGFNKLIGAGFVVVAAGRKALVMTASHNFYSHGLIQSPKNRYPSTDAPEFKIHPGELFSVNAEKIKAVYRPGKDEGICIIEGVSIIPEIDIALCAVELDKEYSGPIFSHQLGLDSRPPKIGDEVVSIGFSGMDWDWHHVSGDKKKSDADMMQQVELRIGKVTGIFPHGSRHESWPCFETTIPIDANMHGGPVLPFSISNLTMNACAVVAADMSPRSSFNNFCISGYSVMAMIWPSLFLPFGPEENTKKESGVNNLLGLIQKGKVKDAGEANRKISIVQKDLHAVVISRKEDLIK